MKQRQSDRLHLVSADPLCPTVTSVERHPDKPLRVLLRFNDERPIELMIHQVFSLIESLASVTHGVTPCEVAMELGSLAHERQQHVEEAMEP